MSASASSDRGHTMIISVPAKVNDNIAVGDGTSAEPIDINSDGDDQGVLERVVFYYPVKGAEGESYMTEVNEIMKKNALFSPEDLGFIPRSPPFERPMKESKAATIAVNKSRDMKSLGREELLTDNVIDMFVSWLVSDYEVFNDGPFILTFVHAFSRFNHLQQSPYLYEKNHNFKSNNNNYYVFSIQHTTKLREDGPEYVVEHFLPRIGVDLFDCKLLLFPLVDQNHYSLMVVANPAFAERVYENCSKTMPWPG